MSKFKKRVSMEGISMRKLLFFTLLLLFSIALIGCQQSSTTHGQENNKSSKETLKIYEMESFQKVKKESLLVVNDPEFIDIAEKTISTADKIPGIVNVGDPEYKIEIKGETYFLWSREESATIMNAEDTNTVYTVQPKQAKKVHEFLKAEGFAG